ncbi:hypothetical protein AJ78_07242 [Emergomyces pasteurianus Ep9510]|uniref:Enoyl reductase (ER) domain-containing protein n=1 Tax=Emergomyces pasteurianus Ep9510 TaxID=1447872 RepID=A0A1J9P862_9EURO|nr:hypothetical protein AJ78_07242 [Emergomyces pasteurianus Ep9510]
MATSNTQKALLAGPNCEPLLTTEYPIPSLPADHILVKTAYVALNPTDWQKMVRNDTIPGALAGCDFSGTVEEIGPNVAKKFIKGEKVMGFNHGFDRVRPTAGAFAEYEITKGDLLLRVPKSLPMDQAASMPLGLYTVNQGLYQGILKLALPNEPIKGAVPILIYGELGADAAFDYHDKDLGKKIREHTNNSLRLVYDTIATPKTATICGEALSSKPGGKYMATEFMQLEPKDIESDCMIAYSVMNEDFILDGELFSAKQEDFEFAKHFGGIAEKLIMEGKVKAHRVLTSEKGGFEGIPDGWAMMRENKVSGQKLVYKV